MEAIDCAERSWAWVLEQVRWDRSGPWIPGSVTAGVDATHPDAAVRDCLYDGIGGLALALDEVRLTRGWSPREELLSEAIVARLTSASRSREECSLYLGVAGDLTAIGVLDPSVLDLPLQRLAERVTPKGWPTTLYPELGYPPINDLLLGNAGVVLAAAWVGSRGDELVALGAQALLAAAEPAATGLDWPMLTGQPGNRMPNYSHGTAGIATALGIAGHRLQRPDLIAAAVAGAEHVIALADTTDGRFRAPHYVPQDQAEDRYAYGWCHGPTGTSLLFSALELAGVTAIGGRSCPEWLTRCLAGVRASGLPERLRPGFWDNDGVCCGTAGVANLFLDHARRDTGGEGLSHRSFARELTGALVDRAVPAPSGSELLCWRFLEHRRDPPLLDPGVGWMQGAAGISATLFRQARVDSAGLDAPRRGLPDNWWAVPTAPEARPAGSPPSPNDVS